MLNQDTITNALKSVKYPGYSRDIISFGIVKNVAANNGAVSVTIELTSANNEVAAQLKQACEQAIRTLPEAKMVHIEVKMPAGQQAPVAGQGGMAAQNRIPGLARIIAVASGKGGVGKSTCSVNLACALRHLGAKVGLLDCDIYGPSIPLMMGIRQRPTISAEEKMVPPINHGVKLMSMGVLVDGDQPVIWRGPMITKTIQQFFQAVDWGQSEAAGALGLRRGLVLRLVVLPQALRVIIPPTTNQYLNLTKNSSLAVAVGYPELTSVTDPPLNQTGQAVECITIMMAIYLAISLSISAGMNVYNRIVQIPDKR